MTPMAAKLWTRIQDGNEPVLVIAFVVFLVRLLIGR